MSGPPEPELTIAADRPFIYLIRHRESGLVLFAGHVTDLSQVARGSGERWSRIQSEPDGSRQICN